MHHTKQEQRVCLIILLQHSQVRMANNKKTHKLQHTYIQRLGAGIYKISRPCTGQGNRQNECMSATDLQTVASSSYHIMGVIVNKF